MGLLKANTTPFLNAVNPVSKTLVATTRKASIREVSRVPEKSFDCVKTLNYVSNQISWGDGKDEQLHSGPK